MMGIPGSREKERSDNSLTKQTEYIKAYIHTEDLFIFHK